MVRAYRLVCIVGGLAFASSIPPLDAPPLAYAGLALFAVGLESGALEGGAPRTPPHPLREGALRGLFFGTALNLLGLRFVPDVVARFTPLPWLAGLLALVLLAVAQGASWCIAGLVRAALVQRRVPGFLAFALAIYGGSLVPAVFPFTAAGPLAAWPALMQLGDLVGERGVALVVALGAALLVRGLQNLRSPRAVGAALAVPAALLAYGDARIQAIEARRHDAPHVVVAALGPGIGASERWSAEAAPALLARSQLLTRLAEANGAALTVWTESAYPYVLDPSWRRAPIGAWDPLAGGLHGPVLLGAVLKSSGGDAYNGALVAERAPDGEGLLSAPYEKLHLLWFGETVPLADVFPWLRHTFLRGVGLSPGAAPVLLTAGAVRAGVLICFEDTLPRAGREAASLHPNLLVNLTNDAWFTGSAESALHLRLASWRAVEARRDLVRAVNLGPVSFVDAAGRVLGRYDGPQPSVLATAPALLDGPPTFYARFGDAPLGGAALGFLVTSWILRRVRGGRSAGVSSLRGFLRCILWGVPPHTPPLGNAVSTP